MTEQRRAFEAWAKDHNPDLFVFYTQPSGIYCDDITYGAWLGYQAGLALQAQQSQWMPIETAPKNTKIIVSYKNIKGKDRTVFAKYIEKFTEESTYDTDCETDYCEDDDSFYLKEGWVVLIDNWDQFSSVYFDPSHVPTHWMHAPSAPEGGK